MNGNVAKIAASIVIALTMLVLGWHETRINTVEQNTHSTEVDAAEIRGDVRLILEIVRRTEDRLLELERPDR